MYFNLFFCDVRCPWKFWKVTKSQIRTAYGSKTQIRPLSNAIFVIFFQFKITLKWMFSQYPCAASPSHCPDMMHWQWVTDVWQPATQSCWQHFCGCGTFRGGNVICLAVKELWSYLSTSALSDACSGYSSRLWKSSWVGRGDEDSLQKGPRKTACLWVRTPSVNHVSVRTCWQVKVNDLRLCFPCCASFHCWRTTAPHLPHSCVFLTRPATWTETLRVGESSRFVNVAEASFHFAVEI